jgi:hypothetical protein
MPHSDRSHSLHWADALRSPINDSCGVWGRRVAHTAVCSATCPEGRGGSDKPGQQEHERSLRATDRIPCRPLLRPHQRVPAEVSPNAELSVTKNWGWLAGIVCHRPGVLDALAQLSYAEVAEKGDERTAWPLYALGT